jgi:hypothetical protein
VLLDHQPLVSVALVALVHKVVQFVGPLKQFVHQLLALTLNDRTSLFSRLHEYLVVAVVGKQEEDALAVESKFPLESSHVHQQPALIVVHCNNLLC